MSNHGSMFMNSNGRPGINWKHPWVKAIAGAGIGLVLLTIILIIAVPGSKKGNSNDNSQLFRPDCLPELTSLNQTDQKKCNQRGCVFDSNPKEGHPSCYYPDDYLNYEQIFVDTVKSVTNSTCQPHTWNIVVKKGKRPSVWKGELQEFKATVSVIDDTRVRVKITDPEEARWQVPLPDINSAIKNIQSVKRKCKALESALYDLDVTVRGEISIKRKSTGKTIFATDLRKLIFADQFIEVRVEMSNNITYGLSEHLDRFAKIANSTKNYTIFNNGDPIIRSTPGYGSHPFALTLEPHDNNTYDGTANGILLFSSNGMEIVFSEHKVLTFRLIGGIVDFIIFTGPTGVEVLRQKSELIGHPFMPPFWSLGFHICRFGYKNTSHIESVYKRTREAGIPFDVQWADIDYMDRWNMFTYDKNNFKDLPKLVEKIHKDKLHFVPIIDPAVSGSEAKGTYPPYEEGEEMGIFVRDPKDEKKNWEGKVWNGVTSIFPDFTNPKTSEWWIKHLTKFHEDIPFDGLWIDMNEPTTFNTNVEGDCPKDLIDSKYDYPEYPLRSRDPLFNQTMCLQNKQYLGNHYNLHNMYAFYEAKMTNEALRRIRNKRPFIISRATTTGQGVFGGHWNGDIHASWDHLKMSIPTLLDFNLYGMPMVGADICGFFDNYEEKMCLRWQQLGAFYPFSRNHNTNDTIDQDPGNPDVPESVRKATINALKLRYSLLPYLNTLFYKAHKSGDPVMVPMVLNYPQDVNTHDIDTQFMWGDSLLITPIVEPDTNTTQAYFPKGVWYDYTNLTVAIKANGTFANLTFDEENMGVFVRGGSIIPWQEAKQQTSQQLASPLRLLVALDENQSASGSLYWDDGDTIDPVKYTLADISFNSSGKPQLTYTPKYNLYPGWIDRIILLNAQDIKFHGCKIKSDTDCKVLEVKSHKLIAEVDLDVTESWSIEFSIEGPPPPPPTTVTAPPPPTTVTAPPPPTTVTAPPPPTTVTAPPPSTTVTAPPPSTTAASINPSSGTTEETVVTTTETLTTTN